MSDQDDDQQPPASSTSTSTTPEAVVLSSAAVIAGDRKRPAPDNSDENAAASAASANTTTATATTTDDAPRHQPRVRVHNERMLKVLLTDHEAGVLIGRGGSSVNELQQRTGARVKVSNSSMLFPGTQLRTILIEGGQDSVDDTVRELVRLALKEHNKRESIPDEAADSEFVFVTALPSAAAPVVIGKGGATILDLNSRTGCHIKLGKYEDEIPGVRERVARFMGREANIVAAVLGTMELLYKDTLGRAWAYDNRSTVYDVRARDDGYDRHRREESSSSSSSRRAPPSSSSDDRQRRDDRRDYRGGNDSSMPPPQPSASSASSSSSSSHPPLAPPPPLGGGLNFDHKLQVSVPDEFVGQMLGRAGENISVIQRQTRTRISVSPRNEFVPGTRDRIVTICGASQAACREAEALLGDKLPKL